MTDRQSIDEWLAEALGHRPRDAALFRRALTHPSTGDADYQRLEFLGDRVLGLAVATRLYERHPDEPEGQMNRRLAASVSRACCAAVGRDIGLQGRVRLGKQARDDGAAASDNVLGDVLEALIGALYLDAGFEVARAFVDRAWRARLEAMDRAPEHPKSALQEWAAAQGLPSPSYRVIERSGPDHCLRFLVRAEIAGRASAEADGSSKQEAETAAARNLLERLT